MPHASKVTGRLIAFFGVLVLSIGSVFALVNPAGAADGDDGVTVGTLRVFCDSPTMLFGIISMADDEPVETEFILSLDGVKAGVETTPPGTSKDVAFPVTTPWSKATLSWPGGSDEFVWAEGCPDTPMPTPTPTVPSDYYDGTWEGNGSENLPCLYGGHWVLTGPGITSATIVVGSEDGTMEQRGNEGSWYYDSSKLVDESTVVTFRYYGGEPGATLKLSHCVEGTESPTPTPTPTEPTPTPTPTTPTPSDTPTTPTPSDTPTTPTPSDTPTTPTVTPDESDDDSDVVNASLPDTGDEAPSPVPNLLIVVLLATAGGLAMMARRRKAAIKS